jgi:hypothetical protein
LSVHCKPGTSAYKLQAKIRRRVCIHVLPRTLCLRSDLASLLRRAPALPRASRLQTSPPCSGGLRCCHVSHGSRLRLPTRKGSGAATCHTAPDPVSQLGRALVLPCAPRLWTLPLCSGGLRRCHVPRDPQRAAGLKNKERLSCPTNAARLACF